MINALFKFIFAILLCLNSFFSIGQNIESYKELWDNFDLEEIILSYQDVDHSILKEKAFQEIVAKAYSVQGNYDSAFYYLNEAILSDSSIIYLVDPIFYPLTKDRRWGVLEKKQLQKIQSKYGSYEKVELTLQLLRMRQKDQYLFYEIRMSQKKFGNRSSITKALWDRKKEINAHQQAQLDSIVLSSGLPKKSIVKGAAMEAVFLIIQHANLEYQERFLPLLKGAAEKNEISKSSLALLTDRINIRRKKKQIYGTQIGRKVNGKAFIYPIEDPANINDLRSQMGLGSIEEYVSRWDLKWPEDYQEE